VRQFDYLKQFQTVSYNQAVMHKEKLQVLASILIIVLLIISFQYQSLNIGMIGDDYSAFRSYSSLELTKSFYSDICELVIPCSEAYRPISILMTHSIYKIFGFDPYKLHMMLIFLQILQTIIIFFFFRILTQRNAAALAGCLLFPLNPNLWLHFTWNIEISNAIGMIFFLLSLVSLISYIRNPKYFMILLHFFFAILAYLSKETYYSISFISILTIVFYRKSIFKKYLPIVGWHLIIFTTYLAVRFFITKKWGGGFIVSPDHYSGITLYAWNYVRFLGDISLFNHYISSGFGHFILYIGIICIILISLKKVWTSFLILYGEVNLKLLIYFFLFVFSLQSLWLLRRINIMPELLQREPQFMMKGFVLDSMHYKDILFLYSIVIYIVITLIWVYRNKAIYSGKQSIEGLSRLERTTKNHFNELSNPGEKEILVKFFSYSFFILLVSSLPMFFYPTGRIMNVITLGMSGVFASGIFIVLSMLKENNFNSSPPVKKLLLRYTIVLAFVLFVLNNSLMFKNNYMGPHYKNNDIPGAITAYLKLYPFFKKYDLKEHGAYLFNKLISAGLVDRASGKFVMEKIENLYPERIDCLGESELGAFQPPDASIYPITN